MITQLPQTVIFLYVENAQGIRTPAGTAFVVGYPSPKNPTEIVPLIVTAKHVVAGQSRMLARFAAASATAKAIDVTYDLDALRKNGDYWEHPDPSVDLAVFRSLHFAEAGYRSIPPELLATKEQYQTADIKETDRIVFPSLLVGLQGMGRDYPVVREGSIALLPGERIPIEAPNSPPIPTELVLLNAAANQGSSGAPVFLWPGPRIQHGSFAIGGTAPLLLGIVKGFFTSQPRPVDAFDFDTNSFFDPGLQRATQPPHKMALVFREDSRVGMMVPSWQLRELLDQDAVKKRLRLLVTQTP